MTGPFGRSPPKRASPSREGLFFVLIAGMLIQGIALALNRIKHFRPVDDARIRVYVYTNMDHQTHSGNLPATPEWDGQDMFEGLIIFAARESVVELSEWMRLTSLVCNQYRHCARGRCLSQGRKS